MMTQQLDEIHHIAIQVKNIQHAVDWYTTRFKCEVTYQDETWAFLQFENTSLALVIPSQHPYHVAITQHHLEEFGEVNLHRDGTQSVYIKDPDGNTLEMLKP